MTTMPLPKLTPDALQGNLLEMCGHVTEMLRLTQEAFQRYSAAALNDVADIARHVHHHEKRMTAHIAMQLREQPYSLGPAEHFAFLPAALERIGDSVEALARCIALLHREDLPFSEKAHREVLSLFRGAIELIEGLATALRNGRGTVLAGVQETGRAFQVFCDEIAPHHHERLIHGVCTPRASSVFLSMLDAFREIERYVQRMAAAIEKATARP